MSNSENWNIDTSRTRRGDCFLVNVNETSTCNDIHTYYLKHENLRHLFFILFYRIYLPYNVCSKILVMEGIFAFAFANLKVEYCSIINIRYITNTYMYICMSNFWINNGIQCFPFWNYQENKILSSSTSIYFITYV